jgi:protein-disulfide isomerase
MDCLILPFDRGGSPCAASAVAAPPAANNTVRRFISQPFRIQTAASTAGESPALLYLHGIAGEGRGGAP